MYYFGKNKDLIASLQKTDIEQKVDLGVILGQKILEFKKENNAKFDEIFEVIDEIIAKYKSDEEFRQQIKDIIKRYNPTNLPIYQIQIYKRAKYSSFATNALKFCANSHMCIAYFA
ncbi:hypothetical protein ZA02_01990 [Campylobacter lanienae]|uniref:hypothetical protein n=1 Tax=Campylobacter lanienae TaxID=75658 RepID=UPI0011AC39A7|nr:hypothetical protein [Campylobacter lanienae]TWO17251.1 hypothetical protein ZA02_01990 [Campylobacter lanienae]